MTSCSKIDFCIENMFLHFTSIYEHFTSILSSDNTRLLGKQPFLSFIPKVGVQDAREMLRKCSQMLVECKIIFSMQKSIFEQLIMSPYLPKLLGKAQFNDTLQNSSEKAILGLFWGFFLFFFNLWVIFRGVEYSTDPQNIFVKILLPQSKSFLLDFVNWTKTKENRKKTEPPKKRPFWGGDGLSYT